MVSDRRRLGDGELLKRSLPDQVIGQQSEYIAPAKVNLRLKVTGRRSDGYHLLSMLNVSASLCDTLKFKLHRTPDLLLEINPTGVISTSLADNLVMKAWNYFWDEFVLGGAPCGVLVSIQKRIPIGGGLGGGSSDAGATLRFLRDVFAKKIQEALGISHDEFTERILSVALKVGADVPYAYFGGTCWVTGIGDEIRLIPRMPLDSRRIFIVMPAVSVPTVEFYSFYRQRRPVIDPTDDQMMQRLVKGEFSGALGELIENDFEEEIINFRPAVGEALKLAREFYPDTSSITGSGAAIFSLIQGETSSIEANFRHEMDKMGMMVYSADLIIG
jgi:4-diphosphocytidyl-2-C-methyl-D-erythritol kinase